MRRLCLTFLFPLFGPISAFAAEGHDYAPLGHIQGYHLTEYQERRFDRVDLQGDPGQKITVEGHIFSVGYRADDCANYASDLEIYLSYLEQLKSLKAELLHTPANMNDDNEHVLARFYRNAAPVYVYIHAWTNCSGYELLVVEEQQFKSSIVGSPSQ